MRAVGETDARRGAAGGRHFGKYSAIVKDNRDDQQLGQLQLSVPTLFPPDELVTARAALPYGFFFVPDVDAKVWVEFEGGDPGLPIWTGIQYVAGEWAAEAGANPPERRVIKTAAGHLVKFHDKSGEEKIEIEDGANGHIVTLDMNGVHIKDGRNQHEITLGAQGINIKDGVNQHSITLASAGISIETIAGAKVEWQGPMVKLSSSAAMPVLRIGDSGVGNLGAPVPLIGPGNPMVLA